MGGGGTEKVRVTVAVGGRGAEYASLLLQRGRRKRMERVWGKRRDSFGSMLVVLTSCVFSGASYLKKMQAWGGGGGGGWE